MCRGINSIYKLTIEEANAIASKYDTYEKITDFLTTEFNKAKITWNEAQEKYRRQNNSWKF